MNIKQMTDDINRKCDAFEAKLGYTTIRTMGPSIIYDPSGYAVRLNTDQWKWQLDKMNLRTLIVARILFGGKISRMD